MSQRAGRTGAREFDERCGRAGRSRLVVAAPAAVLLPKRAVAQGCPPRPILMIAASASLLKESGVSATH